MQSISLRCPSERDSWRITTVKNGNAGVSIDHDPTGAPIDILMVEIEPAPPAAGPAKDKTGGERLRTPIELLDDTHLGAIRSDRPSDNASPTDVPKKKHETYSQCNYQKNENDSRLKSHGADADYPTQAKIVNAGTPTRL